MDWNLSRLSGCLVIDQNNIAHFDQELENRMAYWNLMPFFIFSDNLLQDAHITFQNSVDNFEIVHKTC